MASTVKDTGGGPRADAAGSPRVAMRRPLGLVVLDRDILTGPPEEIASARVLRAYVGGELVHAAD
ncbi:hypothetical protein ACH5AR_00170 [Kitasatospora sp. NPDC018619]|uniref:hypothetical protein n=1 Tax=unclassified Kitasatospora TaxID=2633591 RepID=UPI00379058A1